MLEPAQNAHLDLGKLPQTVPLAIPVASSRISARTVKGCARSADACSACSRCKAAKKGDRHE